MSDLSDLFALLAAALLAGAALGALAVVIIGARRENPRNLSGHAPGRLAAGARVVNGLCVRRPERSLQRSLHGLPPRCRYDSVIPGQSGRADCLYLPYDATDAHWATRCRDVAGIESHSPPLAFELPWASQAAQTRERA
jgi:hypothetical protein